MVQVIAHRGASRLAPENTWAAFDAALALGVDAIECDIRRTRDGQLIVIHDARLERTTSGSGAVVDTDWARVRELDAGAWFGAAFAGERVPRLDATLERYAAHLPLVLELKVAAAVSELLGAVGDRDLFARVTFTSFDFATLMDVRRQAPQARTGFLAPDLAPQTVAAVLGAGLTQLCPPAAALTRSKVERCHRLGLEVRAWGVKTEALMRAAIAAGVDGMTIDSPAQLMGALGRGGAG